jgi:hypothetical protein
MDKYELLDDEQLSGEKFEEINPEYYQEDYEEDAERVEEHTPDEFSQEFVNRIIEKIFQFMAVLIGHELHSYQLPLARRIIESVIINDGEEVTALASRQSGKTETVSATLATLMVLLPLLAKIYPDLLGRFKGGLWVGMFAPTESQAETLFSRTVTFLTSERALEVLEDPEIDDQAAKVGGVTRMIRLKKAGSTLTMMTANPRAKIESKSFHVVVIDECQEADDFVVSKSISPMLAYYAGTMIKTGTPTNSKNNFYRAIQLNKRRATARGVRQNHYQWDWRDVAKVNENYAKFIKKEMLRIGEDSDEFQMSYNCLAPGTKVLTADLRHVPIESLQVGDELVGFEEFAAAKGSHRKFKKTVVTKTTTIQRPTYEITLTDNTVVRASDGHLWLVSTAGRRTVWKRTDELTITDRIFKLFDTWEHTPSYETGYLAAAFDGEGHFSRQNQLGFSQRENVMLSTVRKYLSDFGFKTWERSNTGTNKDVTVLQVAGGKAQLLKLLGTIRPERLLQKIDIDSWGSIGRHDFAQTEFEHPGILDVKYIGTKDVIALETSTQTFVAEGLASHNCKWLLERGMFVTSSVLDELGDKSQELVKVWHKTPVVVGIDPARKMDATVVTVVWVDWDRPDEFGYYDHRVLNWLEIQGDDWEEQYFQIVNFLNNYDVLAIGVDSNGVGDAVAQRLKVLMPRSEVIPLTSSPTEQSRRFKHLQALIQRRMLAYPAHAKTKRLRVWKQFYQQLTDAEVHYKGPNFTVEAPKENYAHDDFVDSLAIACSMTVDLVMPEVESTSNIFY